MTHSIEQEETDRLSGNVPEVNVKNKPQLPEKIRLLKEAFPDTDTDVIEAILQTQNDDLERAFESLLSMSDPAIVPESTPIEISVEEQLRLDEELARNLYFQEEERNRLKQQQQQQLYTEAPYQQREYSQQKTEDDFFAAIQEELPIIKEKMKEAGNAAKKKVLDLYNQFKVNTQKENKNTHPYDQMTSSSIPTTNARYRGLPSDDGDDLLTGDISALHLSDYDVYTKTRQTNSIDNDIIHVNPPINSSTSKVQTSTSDAQLKSDEDFARRLAEQDQLEESTHHIASRNNVNPTTINTSNETHGLLGESDYEEIRLAASSHPKPKNDKPQEEVSTSIPYVIGDDDDSDLDEDDLVDFEDEDNEKDKPSSNTKK